MGQHSLKNVIQVKWKRNVEFLVICRTLHTMSARTGDQINCRRAPVGQRDLENVTDGAEMQPMLEKWLFIRHKMARTSFLRNKFFSPELHMLPSIYSES